MKASRSTGRIRRTLPYASRGGPSLATASTIAIAALSIAALANRQLSRRAEHDNPPVGRFVLVEDVRVHYIERGIGDTVVLLHGNGSMVQDFESSGLVDLAAKEYRVIAFDRPG